MTNREAHIYNAIMKAISEHGVPALKETSIFIRNVE